MLVRRRVCACHTSASPAYRRAWSPRAYKAEARAQHTRFAVVREILRRAGGLRLPSALTARGRSRTDSARVALLYWLRRGTACGGPGAGDASDAALTARVRRLSFPPAKPRTSVSTVRSHKSTTYQYLRMHRSSLCTRFPPATLTSQAMNRHSFNTNCSRCIMSAFSCSSSLSPCCAVADGT